MTQEDLNSLAPTFDVPADVRDRVDELRGLFAGLSDTIEGLKATDAHLAGIDPSALRMDGAAALLESIRSRNEIKLTANILAAKLDAGVKSFIDDAMKADGWFATMYQPPEAAMRAARAAFRAKYPDSSHAHFEARDEGIIAAAKAINPLSAYASTISHLRAQIGAKAAEKRNAFASLVRSLLLDPPAIDSKTDGGAVAVTHTIHYSNPAA